MYVIADMEWVTKKGISSPTQLAAVKVDENWNAIDSFNELIRPRDGAFHDWKHMAYTGATATQFLYARNAYCILDEFINWLNEDDTILWWHSDSKKLFKKLEKHILKCSATRSAMCLNDYVYAFLGEDSKAIGGPYQLAARYGVSVDFGNAHCAENDVYVLRKLLQAVQFPQLNLTLPLVKQEPQVVVCPMDLNMPYQYDVRTNLIHQKDCEQILEVETKGYQTLKSAIQLRYKPCKCCSGEYREVLRERNRSTLDRIDYTYTYTPNSKVFHKYSCKTLLNAAMIMGARKYETVIKTGRVPCKLCNPTADDYRYLLTEEYKQPTFIKPEVPVISLEDRKAIKRQQVASAERYRRLQDETLTEVERDDVYTLTQPRFAFWAGQGYQTFHRRCCPKLNDVSSLRGFGSYKDAVRAGYTPCRKCKPTEKHDISLSIPIYSHVRENEQIEDLEVLCNDAGYSYVKEEKRFCFETPVGKWRIYTEASPIKLEHINLAKNPWEVNYHKQPRLFLSLVDAFRYIKRHDEKLTI